MGDGKQPDRLEWLEHLVPLSFLRVLWDSLFPSRFRRIVLEGLDGTPAAGYARPLTFCLGCWLLLYAVGQTFPWMFGTANLNSIFIAVPVSERAQVVKAVGIDTIPGVVPADSIRVIHGEATSRVVRHLHTILGKHAGRVSGSEIAQYLETHGNADLGLRFRGYLARADDRPRPFSETMIVIFVVFGLVPGWMVSHFILGSRRRTLRETRYVHMYNDSWLVIACAIPFFLATYSEEAFDASTPQHALAGLAFFGLVVWIWRTVRLYRVTHDAPVWRVALSHGAGIVVALVMSVLFAMLFGMLYGLRLRAGL